MFVLAGAALLGVLASRGPAQDGEQLGSENAVRDAFTKQKQTYYNLLSGRDKVDGKSAEVADAASKFFIYPVTWHSIKADPTKLRNVVEDFDKDMRLYVLPAKNTEFRTLYAAKLAERLQEVFKSNAGDQKTILNASLMLLSAAKTKHDKVDDLLTNLMKDPKTHDAVKNYAMKAMAEFPVEIVNTLQKDGNKARRDRDVARVTELMKFIEGKPGNNVTPEAFQFVRRSAVRALAQTGYPAVEFDKTRKVHAPAVLGLLRVLAPAGSKHALDPPPRLDERLEAAIGFCNMRFGTEVDPDDLYQPEIGLYLMGRHFFPDFVDAYRKDFGRFKAGSVPTTPALPWKIEAKTFDLALQTFLKNARNKEVDDKARKFVAYAKPFLDKIAGHQQIVDAPDRGALENMLHPKSGSAFRNLKEPDFLK